MIEKKGDETAQAKKNNKKKKKKRDTEDAMRRQCERSAADCPISDLGYRVSHVYDSSVRDKR